MTLSISSNRWVSAVLGAGAIAALTLLWAYLAGGIFLVAFGQRFDDATPLTVYQYWYHYGQEAPVQRWLTLAAGAALAAIVMPLILVFAPAKRSLYGEARFARRYEIRKAGLLGDAGLIVGRLGRRYLMFDGQQHAIISAPTRSGKGVGVVIPNLLNWPGSAVVLDMKHENWGLTSAYRARYGQRCYLFSPAAPDYRTHRYNPLAYISADPNFRINDVQKIATMLFPDVPGTDVIWTATPRTLFVGIVLYLLETPEKPVTLGQVLRETLADGDGAAYFAGIINERQAGERPLSAACVRALNTYVSIAAENTRSGIITGFRSRLALWNNPLVDAATSANDFDLREVRRRRMSIYLGVTPDNLEHLAPLMNLFFQQLIDLNTRELPSHDPSLSLSCLLLMDEFTAIGRIPALSKGISFLAGYGLRVMPIIQSPAQLVEVYGKAAAETFQTNHALQIVFPPKASETHTARDISEWLGYQTVKGKSTSRTRYLFASRSPTESTSDQRRALLLPQEITRLGRTKALIVAEDVPPILAERVVYHQDERFLERLREVSPALAALGRKLPSKAQMDAAVRAGELAAAVPQLDMAAHEQALGAPVPIQVRAGGQVTDARQAATRPVTPEDVPKLAKMSLANFAVDFSPVPKPQPGQLDEAALHAYADNLCRQAGILP